MTLQLFFMKEAHAWAMSTAMIEVTGITKRYGATQAVRGISFQVRVGEVFGVLGPNGAGKTTTLEMMESLRSIDGGSVTLDGLDVGSQPVQVRRVIGVQLQSSSFYRKVTLRESLELFASFYNNRIDAMELLRQVGLEDKARSYPERLSGGQKQRFSIAIALVNQPKVLFLDEPTTGLDPQARRSLWELIQTLKEQGLTIVLTTHYMEEAELLCDRVAIMKDGDIIALDSPRQLVRKLVARGFKKEQVVEQASLEDVYISITGKGLEE